MSDKPEIDKEFLKKAIRCAKHLVTTLESDIEDLSDGTPYQKAMAFNRLDSMLHAWDNIKRIQSLYMLTGYHALDIDDLDPHKDSRFIEETKLTDHAIFISERTKNNDSLQDDIETQIKQFFKSLRD